MEQIRNLGDDRQTAQCAYCGSATSTRDHVPSKVLLDRPYPKNLPVVPACRECNESFSVDEEYVACMIECARLGTTKPEEVSRENISRILSQKAALRTRLTAATELAPRKGIRVEHTRLHHVVLKLAQGHALFELNEPQYEEPKSVCYVLLHTLSGEELARFEEPKPLTIWPEMGSRGMQRVSRLDPPAFEWVIVQPERYRYMAYVDSATTVKFVLSEYLACEVIWAW